MFITISWMFIYVQLAVSKDSSGAFSHRKTRIGMHMNKYFFDCIYIQRCIQCFMLGKGGNFNVIFRCKGGNFNQTLLTLV